MKFSIRIAGSVTSLSLRKNIVALWLSLSTEEKINPLNNPKDIVQSSLNGKVLNFVYVCLSKWENDNGKGLGEFISEQMIQDILEKSDYRKYKQILTYI